MAKKTLRLVIPEWHGGMNPDYVFGSELLAQIVPPGAAEDTVKICVDTEVHEHPQRRDGIDEGDFLLRQMQETRRVLEERRPDKVIVLGGDCSVTQTPFAYLSETYGSELGVLWLDAHPDISGPARTTAARCAEHEAAEHTESTAPDSASSAHLHEMVLANLLGLNPDSELTAVRQPVETNRVLMAGLIEEDLREMDRACKELDLLIVSPEELKRDSRRAAAWIRENNIKYLAIHWDLDVLSPVDFRSIYPAEPYTDAADFPAAVGRMTLRGVGRLLRDLSREAELVGLSITEHLPWDAMNLRRTLAGLELFQS